MSASIHFSKGSLSKVLEQLSGVSEATAAKFLGKSTREAFAPVHAEAVRLAPHLTGALAGSIKMRTVYPQGDHNPLAASGIMFGKRRMTVSAEGPALEGGNRPTATVSKNDASWRWHFAEFGTIHHAATPFLRPAFARHASQMVNRFVESTRKNIHAALLRELKRSGGAALFVALAADLPPDPGPRVNLGGR